MSNLLELKTKLNIKTMRLFSVWFGLTVVVLVICMTVIFGKGLKLGIDFTGGTHLLFRVQPTPTISQVREILPQTQIDEIERSQIQLVDQKDISIKTRPLSEAERQQVNELLKKNFKSFEVLEVDTIGPSIGAQLASQSKWIVLITLLGLLAYITVRFEFLFGLAAVWALIHDALVTFAFASLVLIEIDTAFVAAILTILGYSINDTIILFDRYRELKNQNSDEDSVRLGNAAISQVLARSLNTVGTVLVVLISLYYLGGKTTQNFALVLFVGVSSGAYSSNFVAMPAYLFLKRITVKK